MLHIDFVSLFPNLINGAVSYSILQRAQDKQKVLFGTADPRSFVTDIHRTIDDKPFGGGAGMLMMAEPVAQAIESLLPSDETEIIFTDPIAPLFEQKNALELSQKKHLIFVCGRYEGIDERVKETFATKVFSIGDYIISGGELAALVMADAIVRLIPTVLGKAESLDQDSYSDKVLSYPQYTRPSTWRGQKVPQVLLSGHHQQIAQWRAIQAVKNTADFRPAFTQE